MVGGGDAALEGVLVVGGLDLGKAMVEVKNRGHKGYKTIVKGNVGGGSDIDGADGEFIKILSEKS